MNNVRLLLKKNGLKSKKKKEKIYCKNDAKLITDIILSDSAMKLPNCRHKKIYDELQKIDEMSEAEKKSLQGRIVSAAQIDSKFRAKLAYFNKS